MAIAFVQSRNVEGSGTSVALAFSSNTTAGNFLVAGVGSGDTAPAVTGVADNHSQTFLSGASITTAALQASTWHFCNCVGGADTVTASFNASMFDSNLCIAEFSGMQASSSGVLDQSTGQSGSGTSVSSPTTPQTAMASELLIGVATTDVAFATYLPGASYTELADAGSTRPFHFQYRIVTVKGTYNSTETLSASGVWVAAIATYKSVAESPGITPDYRLFPKTVLRYPSVFDARVPP